MPKVQVIARREADFARANRSEAPKMFKNTNPDLHPLPEQTEYVRAVRAAKLKRMFSKPLVGSLSGHSDSVYSLTRHPRDLTKVVSGGADGEVRVWDVATRECVDTYKTTRQVINDVSCSPSSALILGVSNDGHVNGFGTATPFSYTSGSALQAVDHSWEDDTFATAGAAIELWKPERNTPFQSFVHSDDCTSYTDVCFNQNEMNLIAATGSDRSITLMDTRTRSVVRTIVLEMKSNCVDWNPQSPFHFIVGNDDSACYMFDIRQTGTAVRVYPDHLGPVTSINFSLNGKEFATGSYDESVRIWDIDNAHSRSCYHTFRMQRVFSVCVSADSKFVLTGSEDMSIRIWKAVANEDMRIKTSRMEDAQRYQERLLQKWRHAPEVKAIAQREDLPKKLYNKKKQRAAMMAAANRKILSKMAHSANPESEKPKPLRTLRIVSDQ